MRGGKGENMRNTRVQALVEMALSVALAAILNFLALRLPINLAGGSVSLCMLPIAVLALRRGVWAGAGAGAIFGLLDLLMEPYILFPAQVILDYPLPYLLLGAGVGLFAGLYNAKPAEAAQASATHPSHPNHPRTARSAAIIAVALLAGGTLRYASHVLSGVLFFSEYAGGENVWAYSLVYNISYLGPSLAVSLLCALVVMPILDRAVPVD